ncbi:MAG: branched-chain amino acid ABC transporter permease [Alicyclobacillus sp.]|nr:branched-chain amino acid ABC transporter permease [Alicyclobacillus sp.]
MNRPNLVRTAATIAAAALAVVVGWLLNPGTVGILTPIAMYLALAQGWNLLGGYAGYLNLGTASLFGLGAFGAGIVSSNFNEPLPVALLAGVLLAVAGGVFMGALSLRLRGAYFAIFTFVSIFVLQAIANTIGITHGAQGIMMPSVGNLSYDTLTRIWYSSFVAVGALATCVVLWVERSRWGAALVAIREDEAAAEVLGIRTTRLKMLAFLVAAVVSGLAGGLYAFQQQFIYPSTIFADSMSLEVVLMAIAGGGGSWLGPIIGTPLVMGVSSLLELAAGHVFVFGNGMPPQLERIIYGVLLVVVGLFLPRGIVDLVRRRRRPPQRMAEYTAPVADGS